MAVFFIDTEDGRVATGRQLAAVDALSESGHATPPWHPIQGPGDASTMWYAVMRKRRRGVFIGTLCFRHPGRLASLREAGWEEVPVEAIGTSRAGESAPAQAM